MKRHAAILAALCLVASFAAADIPGLGAYTYDGSGNITAIGSQTYRYDAFGRLAKATLSPQNEQTYTYDRYGNLVTIGTKLNGVSLQSQRPAVNPCTNRIQLENIPGCANASNYNVVGTYDAAGNVLALEGNSFEYDVLNTTTATTVASVRRVHLYSASGERVASVTMNGGAPLRWDWTLRDSSNRVLRRLSFQGNVWRWEEDYIYAAGKLIAAAVPTPEKVLHFHTDHLGTPRLITGNGGARVSEHNYFPFGREVPTTSQQSTAIPAFDEAKKFTGHERDAATLDYMHARYYATYLGRFLSVDPGDDWDYHNPQTWNAYSYARNNPTIFTDPDGQFVREIFEYFRSLFRKKLDEQNPPPKTDTGDPNHRALTDHAAGASDQEAAYLTNKRGVVQSGINEAGATVAAAGATAGLLVGTQAITNATARLGQSALDHIIYRHWSTSGFTNVGRFAPGTSARALRVMIDTASRLGTRSADRLGRTRIEIDLGRQIGIDRAGLAASRLRIIIDRNGNVITAFPIR